MKEDEFVKQILQNQKLMVEEKYLEWSSQPLFEEIKDKDISFKDFYVNYLDKEIKKIENK